MTTLYYDTIIINNVSYNPLELSISQPVVGIFNQIGINTNKTHANFVLLNFDKVKINSKKVFNSLANSGILVRRMDPYGIKNSLRVTIGKNNENKKFISKMRNIFNVYHNYSYWLWFNWIISFKSYR